MTLIVGINSHCKLIIINIWLVKMHRCKCTWCSYVANCSIHRTIKGALHRKPYKCILYDFTAYEIIKCKQ